jgi:tetratricopeptide (TPR) repeat protein
MGIDVFDIVAVILGVIFTIRKLDAQRREPEEFPHVHRAEFLTWRTQETRVYLLGMMACFSKVLAKVLIAQVLATRLPYSTLRWLGACVDISWLFLVVITLVGAVRMGRRKLALRIVLGGLVVSDGLALGSDLKGAVAHMKAGRLSEAQTTLNQISADADEAQRAIALYYLGECYALQGKLDEARDAFQESSEIDPSLTQPKAALVRLRQEQANQPA